MKRMLSKTGILSVLCALMLCVTMFNCEQAFAGNAFNAPDGMKLTALKEFSLAPGISEQHITMLDKNGNQVQGYAAVVDLSNKNTGIMASYKDYDSTGKWGFQTVRDQAVAAEKKTDKRIVAATNGDYFNMSTGEPLGALVMNGKQVKAATAGADPYYFAILNDGTAEIRGIGDSMDDVQEAIGAPVKLVSGGQAVEGCDDSTKLPVNSVGIKEDGTVIFLGADGRQAPKSIGLTHKELADVLVNMGCVEALYLDGGGSYTYASVSEGASEMTVKNSPSDGIERKVSSAIMIYSTANPSGEFDHASITPNNEIYTPGSVVEFKAVGADSSGSKAPVPDNAKLTLKDGSDSLGSITDDGKFTSNGNTGKVEVQLELDGEVVGSTYIEIQNPDKISFTNEEVSLGFEEETDFGLSVTYNDRQINYKDGDFIWSVSDLLDQSKNPVTDESTELGTFTGNTFKSSDGKTLYGTVTCKSKTADVSGSISVIVGLQPTVVMNFEDYVNPETGETTRAKEYWTFNRAAFDANGGMAHVWDTSGNYLGGTDTVTARLVYGHYLNDTSNKDSTRGGNESAEIVNISDDEPVKKGNSALKINYDFSNINGIEGACVGFAEATTQIPGNPTAIGMYVYCPEDTPNFWLRLRLKDGNGAIVTVNFTPGATGAYGAKPGMDWSGWKYVEADLTGKQGPFSLIGGETIRVMHTAHSGGDGMGDYILNNGDVKHISRSDCKGSIYVDNLQFVYGTNTDDTDNPVIGTISANGVAIEDDTVIGKNDVNFEAIATDVVNKYTSGVDFSTVNVLVDGVNVTEKSLSNRNLVTDSSKDAVYLYNQKLNDGTHSLQVVIRDKEGNEISKSVTFEVKGVDWTKPNVKVSTEESAYLGEYTDINVDVDKTEAITDSSVTFKLGKDFTDYKVAYGDNYEEKEAPQYNAKNNTVKVQLKKKDGVTAEGSDRMVTLSVKVPETSSEDSKFTYSIASGSYTCSENETDSSDYTFSTKTRSLPIKARYTLKFDTMIAGVDANITVTKENGDKAPDMTIYTKDGEEVGVTDLKGTLTTSRFREVQAVSIYAQDADGKRSFIVNGQSYDTGANADGTPTHINLNASKNPKTSKSITWMSKPYVAEKNAVVKVALKSEYEKNQDSAFEEVKGTCKLMEFNGSPTVSENKVVYVNTVNVTGLKANKEYVYKVGDGDKLWSDVREFSTLYGGEDSKFFIIGDIQGPREEAAKSVIDNISKGDYTLGIQLGDFVEKSTLYNEWDEILGLFDNDEIAKNDFIHVTGNHEIFGDVNISNSLFDIDNNRRYSVTYGNVYIAVIGYLDGEEEHKDAAEWLVSDAARSDARWKIVLTHQPPYGTNASATDCGYMTEYLPDACEQAGIDFVFSGHDHALTRTEPVKGGEVVESDKDGVIYYVCGAVSKKAYPISTDRGYHFAVDPTTDYDGVYLEVDATDSRFTVNVYSADGSLMNDYCYTKGDVICENDNHDYYCDKDGYLVCNNCGAVDKIDENTTGVILDKETKVARYIKDGEFVKSQWVFDGDDSYYIGKDGYAVTGTTTIDGKQYTFNRNGLFVKGSFVKETITQNGKKREITRYYTAGGVYAVRWQEIDGNLYCFKKISGTTTRVDDGEMYYGGTFNIKTAGNKVETTRTFTFDDNGVLIKGAFDRVTDVDGNLVGTRYYWGDDYVKGSILIDGLKYEFDKSNGYMVTKDIADCDISAVSDQYYTGSAIKPTVTVSDGGQKLVKGTNYKVTYSSNKNIGTAKVTIEGNPERGYTGKKVMTFNIKLQQPKLSSAKCVMSSYSYLQWGKISSATSYEVYRATSKDGEYTKLGTVSQKSSPYYKDSKVTLGKTYYYKVRSVVTVSSKKYYSSFTDPAQITRKPVKTTISSVKNYKTKKAKVTWSKVSGATGYKVYRSTSLNGTYKRVKTIKSSRTASYTNTKLSKGKTYYYKVRAYKSSGGKTAYGDYSTAKGVKVVR